MINTNKIIKNIIGEKKKRKVSQNIKLLKLRRRLHSLSSIELPDKFWMVDFTALYGWEDWQDVEVKQYTREEFLKEFPKHSDHIGYRSLNAAKLKYIDGVLYIDTPDSATFIHPNKQKAIDVALKVGINIFFSEWITRNNIKVKEIRRVTNYNIEHLIEYILKPMNLSVSDIKKYVDYLKSMVNKEIKYI